MRFIRGFDGLRALSVTTVLLTHLDINSRIFDYYTEPRLANLIHGLTGVTLFFSISGFLITLLLLNEYKSTGAINIKNFYIRRFLRLSPPLVLLFATIFWLTWSDSIRGTLPGLLVSVLYLYNYMPKAEFTSELTHTWTLAVEEQFYLMWPWALAFFREVKKLILIILTITISCFLFRYFLPDLSYTAGGETVLLTDRFQPSRWFIPAAAPIMIGSLFAFLVHRRPGMFETRRSVSLISAVILYLAPLWLPLILFDLVNYVQSIGFAILIAWIYENQKSWLTQCLSFSPLAFIGKISYGIYVYQGLFLCTGTGGDRLWFQQFPQNIILTLVVAVASYYWVETPFLKLKNKFSPQPFSRD